jgi:hypothetical protein
VFVLVVLVWKLSLFSYKKAWLAQGDGKAENLQKPLLSHAWSAGFSFSKCHLEESAPYDPFTPYVVGVEPFARFARFWTRGYVSFCLVDCILMVACFCPSVSVSSLLASYIQIRCIYSNTEHCLSQLPTKS